MKQSVMTLKQKELSVSHVRILKHNNGGICNIKNLLITSIKRKILCAKCHISQYDYINNISNKYQRFIVVIYVT